jgi:multisite-specific tRNA:(cytosine-C5)-methyltransferase
MFPSGKGSKDIEVNTDVLDADMKDSTDMGEEGEQERNTAIDDSNNGDSAKTEEKTEVDCESGEAPTRYKKLNSTSTRTEHSDYPLHRCMRIVPHDQNSGAFFIAVLRKHSPLNGNVLHIHLFFIFRCLLHQISYKLPSLLLVLKYGILHFFRDPGGRWGKK